MNLNFRDERFYYSTPFHIIHGCIQFIKAHQYLIDVITGQFLSFNRLPFGSCLNHLRFFIFYLIIHPIKTIIKICFPFEIVTVIRVKGIYFFHQFRFYRIELT